MPGHPRIGSTEPFVPTWNLPSLTGQMLLEASLVASSPARLLQPRTVNLLSSRLAEIGFRSRNSPVGRRHLALMVKAARRLPR
jgi:hypothetical protein